MPLTDAQCRDVLRHFLTWVRRKDPVGYETLVVHAELGHENVEGRVALLRAISTYTRAMHVATSSTHGRILGLLNDHIGGDIKGVRVSLSGQEQDLYRRDYVDLTPTIDKTEFVHALKELYHMIEQDGGHGNDSHGA